MTLTATNSTEYGNQVAVPPTPLDPTQLHGRLRVAHFEFTWITGDVNSLLNMVKMPQGKVRILEVTLVKSAFGTGATLDLGHTGYTNLAGTAVAASENAFATALDIDDTANLSQVVDVVVESRGGFTIQGKIETATATAETLSGWFTYVVD